MRGVRAKWRGLWRCCRKALGIDSNREPGAQEGSGGWTMAWGRHRIIMAFHEGKAISSKMSTPPCQPSLPNIPSDFPCYEGLGTRALGEKIHRRREGGRTHMAQVKLTPGLSWRSLGELLNNKSSYRWLKQRVVSQELLRTSVGGL